jgi:hypothetical protein
MPEMRGSRPLAVACVLGLAACGDEPVRPAGNASATAPATPAPTSPPPAPKPAAKPEREVLDPSDEPALRAQRLAPRDAPKAVGEVAPAVPGVPEKTLAVLVFFRGEW